VIPTNDVSRGIPYRLTAEMKPSIHAVRTSQAQIEFERTCGVRKPHPAVDRRDDLGKIVRMDGVQRPPALDLLKRSAKVVEQLTIDEFGLAGGRVRGDESWDAVEQQPKIVVPSLKRRRLSRAAF